MTEVPRAPLDQVGHETASLLRATAEELWDISLTILNTGRACADDWEYARATLSHALAAISTKAPVRSAADHKKILL